MRVVLAEPGPGITGTVAHLWAAYDAAIREAQTEAIEKTGYVLCGLLQLSTRLPVAAPDLTRTAQRMDALAAELTQAAQALREVIDDSY